MKKWLIIVLSIVLLCGGYIAGAHLSGGAWPTLGLPVGGPEALLRKTALSFWEDIQFKDFTGAASYHDPATRDEIDIPFLLERIFAVKPEMLDIMEYEIVFAEVDSTGLRARIKTRLKVKELVRGTIREQEVILYFHRESLESEWYMVLESSLRATEGDDSKKH
jgi:hypothetical protein